MSRVRAMVKPLLAALIVVCTGYFFFRAFRRNWADVKAHEFRIAPLFVAGALLAAFATCLLATFAWYSAMNELSRSKISFRQSVAAVNASSLTKYIPGKIWSYALQMYWLDGLGVSKPLIVYVNLVNLLISMATSVIVGLSCLLFSHGNLPLQIVLASLIALIALDVCSVLFNHAILSGLVKLVNRLFKRKFSFFEVKKSLLVKLHLVHF